MPLLTQIPVHPQISKISAADTTPNYLSSKLSAGNGISLSITSPGANEALSISAPALPATALTQHSLLFAGASGVVSEDVGKLTYNAATKLLTVTGGTNDGTTLVQEWKDSDNATVAAINTDGYCAFTRFYPLVDSSGAFAFYRANKTALVISVDTSNARLGIATGIPARRLDIQDTVNPQARLTQAAGVTYADLHCNSSGYFLATPTGQQMHIVGSTAPTIKLMSGSTQWVALSSDGTTATLINYAGNMQINNNAAGSLSFCTNNIDRYLMTAAGDHATVRGAYHYQRQTVTVDTDGDCRTYSDANGTYFQTRTGGAWNTTASTSPTELYASGGLRLGAGAVTIPKVSTPADPTEGRCAIWMSDGTGGLGDVGDILAKITNGGITKTVTIIDWSAIP